MRGKQGAAQRQGAPTLVTPVQWPHEIESMGRAFCQLGERLIAAASALEQSMQLRASWDAGREAAHATDNATDHPASQLTRSERETLALFAQGMSFGAIAQARGVKICTVRDQTKSARAKLEVASTAQAAAKARQLGLIT